MSRKKDRIMKNEKKYIVNEHDLANEYGYWNEHPKHKLHEWISEVSASCTRQSYWAWVRNIVNGENGY